jgi:hypothetical protein
MEPRWNERYYEEPNRSLMAFRIVLLLSTCAMALFFLSYTKSWYLLAAWFVGLLILLLVPRYYCCARCDLYGRRCHAWYTGLIAAKIFKPQETRELNILGIAGEMIAYIPLFILPQILLFIKYPIWGIVYTVMLLTTGTIQIFHGCRICILYAPEQWKRYCPINVLNRRVWKREEPAEAVES